MNMMKKGIFTVFLILFIIICFYCLILLSSCDVTGDTFHSYRLKNVDGQEGILFFSFNVVEKTRIEKKYSSAYLGQHISIQSRISYF
jgi:hypothetical protein